MTGEAQAKPSYLDELFGLSGKVAVVTGGSRGIGFAVAEGLAKAGADVAIWSRTSAADAVERIEAAGRKAVWIACDVVDEDAVDLAVERTVAELGPIDVLFNNSGICLHKGSFEVTADEFRHIVDVNLTGVFLVARAVVRSMIQHGTKGALINMASISGTIVNTPQLQASYNASKAGVIQLTKSLALEFANSGIRVNSISPGYIATPMAMDTPQELKDAWMPRIPMGRMAEPEELMTAILYLASERSAYTTGSDVIVDGGYTLP